MKDGLYHREIAMPREVATLKTVTICPTHTRHAREAALTDRYGVINLPEVVSFSGADVVEAEITEGRVSKLVVRRPYDETRDIVMAIGFRNSESFLKTVWGNLKTDRHATLRREIYNKSI